MYVLVKYKLILKCKGNELIDFMPSLERAGTGVASHQLGQSLLGVVSKWTQVQNTDQEAD